MPLIDGSADHNSVAEGLAAGPDACLGGPDDETARSLSALGGTGATRERALARPVSGHWRGCTACCCALRVLS
jgi:hypothetical protein